LYEEKKMTTNNKITKKRVRSTALPEKKRDLANIRRRLKRAEKRCEEAKEQVYAARTAADRAEEKVYDLFHELDIAKGKLKPGTTRADVRAEFIRSFSLSTRASTRVANGKLRSFLAATNHFHNSVFGADTTSTDI
jgi:hypothetical protein